VVYITIALTLVCLFLIGVGGYVLFVEKTFETTTLLSLFPREDMLGLICKIFFAVDLFFSVPFQLFMPRLGLTYMCEMLYPSLQTDQRQADLFFYGSTVVLSVMSLLISLVITDLGIVFEICGGVSACVLAYILPPLVAIRVNKGSRSDKIICTCILGMGIIVLLCSVATSISRLI
jgi:sodium-coupled neutral amino acid transporter 11